MSTQTLAAPVLVGRLEQLFADERFSQLADAPTTSLRELIAAVLVAGAHTPSAEQAWREAVTTLNLSNETLTRLLLTDLPRYVGPTYSASQIRCGHIMTAGPRQAQDCRKHGVDSATEYAPDGTWRKTWRCSDHRGELWEIQQRSEILKTTGAIPNHGGLLAAYLPGYAWATTYASVSPTWHCPTHGVNADTWPALRARARLRSLSGSIQR